MRNNNNWHFEEYIEEFKDDDPAKRANAQGGYKDILANAKGGDSIQLWIETNGYAFGRNIKATISVYKKLSLADVEMLEKTEEKIGGPIVSAPNGTNDTKSKIPLLDSFEEINKVEGITPAGGKSEQVKQTD